VSQPDLLPLSQWSWVVVNSSGGKDSQTALRETVRICDAQGYPRDRIVVSHQCLGRMEWEGAMEVAERQATHYNLRFEVAKYRNKTGEELELLEYVKRRKKWPDNKNRFCTSEFKRGPGGRVLTRLSKERPGDILQVFGFRKQESRARAKKQRLTLNTRFTNAGRRVVDFMPILEMTTDEVWADIRQSGVISHAVYKLGMPRFSCIFCVFAPESALRIAAANNPSLFREYCDVEAEIGHDFQHGKPLQKILDTLHNEVPIKVEEEWNL